ncbi:hypothetical protein FHS96_005279 [Sphingomonas zeicaulis]
MHQPDLFDANTRTDRRTQTAAATQPDAEAHPARTMPAIASLPDLLERLAGVSKRPRYAFMVLNLIARAAGSDNSAGPYVSEHGEAVPIRAWLSEAMTPWRSATRAGKHC